MPRIARVVVVPLVVLLALAVLPSRARAQGAVVPVAIDRESALQQIRYVHAQLEQLGQMLRQVGMRGSPAAHAIHESIRNMRQVIAQLDQQVSTAPAANVAVSAPVVAGVVGAPGAVVPAPGLPGAQVVVPAPQVQVQVQAPPPAYPQAPPVVEAQPAQGYATPMDERSLRGLLHAIRAESFSADQLRVLGDAAGANYFLVDQVKRIIPLFSFSNDKLQALKLLAPRILDRQNDFKIYGVFTFMGEKEQARKILGQ